MTLVAAAWIALMALAAVRGRQVPAFSVVYNLPITLVFGALGLDLAIRAADVGVRRALITHGPVITVWSAGAVLLFLRLITRSIDVSGHMTWALVMATQCLVEGAPRWFTVFAWCIVFQVLLLKLFVLGGQSGAWGLLAGGLLSAALVTLERARTEDQQA
jgi:hypothetical protein